MATSYEPDDASRRLTSPEFDAVFRRLRDAPGVDLRTAEWATSAILARGLNAISAAGGARRTISCPMVIRVLG